MSSQPPEGMPIPRSGSILKLVQYAEISMQRVVQLADEGEVAEAMKRVEFIEFLCKRTLEVTQDIRVGLRGNEAPPEGTYDGDIEADMLRFLAELPGYDK